MSRILIAWELGGGYGHLASLAPLAEQLIERGHEVYFALRDLSHAQRMLGKLGCPLLQAPIRLQHQLGLRSASTYAELLALVGFLESDATTGRVRAWRGLFDLVRPDVMIAEHAPTALLAARGLPLRCVAVGTGFSCPPATRPMPVLSSLGAVPDATQLKLEEQVLEHINLVLASTGAPALEAPGDVYAVDDQLVCTFAELDPFAAHRPGAHYAGPRGMGGHGEAPRWPARGTQRVFGYLKTEMPDFEALVRYLSTSPQAVLAHVPGMPEAFVQRFSSPTLTLAPEPVNLNAVARECDGAICLAGHGATCRLLLAGCPLLLVPSQVEQRLTAERVCAMGAGLMVGKSNGPTPYPALIARLLSDASLRAGAQDFAERHRSYDEHGATMNSVQRIEDLLAGAASGPASRP